MLVGSSNELSPVYSLKEFHPLIIYKHANAYVGTYLSCNTFATHEKTRLLFVRAPFSFPFFLYASFRVSPWTVGLQSRRSEWRVSGNAHPLPLLFSFFSLPLRTIFFWVRYGLYPSPQLRFPPPGPLLLNRTSTLLRYHSSSLKH